MSDAGARCLRIAGLLRAWPRPSMPSTGIIGGVGARCSSPPAPTPIVPRVGTDVPPRSEPRLNRRRNPRFRTRFDALCSAGEREGAGTLSDLSRSGARLSGASFCPEPGTKVRLYVFIQPVSPFELVGEVVRSDGRSFAIRFTELDPAVGRLVEDVAAVVSMP